MDKFLSLLFSILIVALVEGKSLENSENQVKDIENGKLGSYAVVIFYLLVFNYAVQLSFYITLIFAFALISKFYLILAFLSKF